MDENSPDFWNRLNWIIVSEARDFHTCEAISDQEIAFNQFLNFLRKNSTRELKIGKQFGTQL